MKQGLIILFFAATSHIAISQVSKKETAENLIQIPKVHLVYLKNGTPFDQACGQALSKPIRQEDINEVFQRLGEF